MKSSFHTYIAALKAEGAPDDYIRSIERNARPLFDQDLPIVLTLGQLASITGCKHQFLHKVVSRNIDPYKVFQIRKRSGGTRTICVPHPALLSLQRWIHSQILCAPEVEKPLSRSATAYRPKSSHIVNARRHLAAKWLVKLDISSFFENISERQVYRVFRRLGYRALVAFCFARLCTRVIPYLIDGRRQSNGRWKSGAKRKFLHNQVVGHLPQGAPTSPMLANFVCESLDRKLEKVALANSLIYTRYADDMTFSGNALGRPDERELIRKVANVISESGFSINLQKTTVGRAGSRRIVTGLSVQEDKLRLPRDYKDELRKDLYFISRFGLDDHCKKIAHKNRLTYLLRLEGRISYAERIEPRIGTALRQKFTVLFPEFGTIKDLVVGN